MVKDQRSGLPILKGVPPELMPEFKDLNNAMMHWMGKVVVTSVVDGAKRKEEHVLVLCPESLYSCSVGNRILRGFKITAIQEVFVNEDDDALLSVPSEFDYFFRPLGGKRDRNIIVKILKRLYFHLTESHALPVKPDPLDEGCTLLHRLQPPKGWKDGEFDFSFFIEPIPSKKQIKKSSGHSDYDAGDDGQRDRIRHLEDQLSTCKDALRQAIGDQNIEIDNIREQFLEYDKEVVAYLNNVYAAFPNVKSALGAPPSVGVLSGLDNSGGNSASTRLQEENSRLRARIQELEGGTSHSSHPSLSQPTQQQSPTYHWHTQSPSSPGRVPAAEARRRYRPAVSGGMGPAGPHRTFTQYATPTSSTAASHQDLTHLDF
eukprot:TRINITY_DN3903_c0_g1_i1.p1 TRINITY_DN3903_c0_g1~~TRINITY_DN3903_c0_g1_i1.p1  ORF type:complete len:374 (+),score=83.58 TRINITY_DN3903_c0_g1_i1:627-1748(+)